ncbi:MAG: universal stress protein [Alphaproteobacteria bacterium]|nr:universal stress protein [Alphaproteobacteria bacterium]
MAFKDIIVHQGEDVHAGRRLAVGLAMAKQFDARLTGIYVLSYPNIPGFVQTELPSEIIEQRYNDIRAAGEARRADFDAATARENVSGEFRVMEGEMADTMALCGRYSDVLVVGQPDPDNPSSTDSLAEDLLLAAGRPILVVPYVGDLSHVGRHVMGAWSGTREATRAVHDALPVLQAAEEVVVFSVNPEDSDHIAGADISTHLARHGVNAITRHIVAPDMRVGDSILSAISDNSIDLLVMGGYGHSRLRELAFGGATRAIMRSMTCPVMMSH